MKPVQDWQIREALDMRVRSPEWQLISETPINDVLRAIALITLDDTIRMLDTKPKNRHRR